LDPRSWPPRRWPAIIALSSIAMFAVGLVLQHGLGLQPCPMCIVQRYALLGVAVWAGLAWASRTQKWLISFSALVLLFALAGAGVAARQSWLQWYPPPSYGCTLDFYGMVENLPIKRALPMIFAGSGDCTKVDWTFLRLSIANWAFLYFVAAACVLGWVGLRSKSAA
jgi:protein dithiol:quinone oxidoreductase